MCVSLWCSYISPTLPRFDLLAAGARVKRSLLDSVPSSGALSDLKHRNFVLDLTSEAAKTKSVSPATASTHAAVCVGMQINT